MRILLIGHSVKDYIHTEEGEIVNPGGIYYSLIGMTNFLDKNDELFLVTSIDKNNEPMFRERFQYINKHYIQYSDRIPTVHLYHNGSSERCEHYENITGKLNLNDIENFNGFDGILINMITGFDINLSDLKDIRTHYNGLLYLDIHTLARGMDEKGNREFRLIPHSEEWIKNVDIIQANESELKTLADGYDDEDRISKILSLELKYLIVTKGEKGLDAYWLKDNNIENYMADAIKIKSINKIGCGDIFGAVFFYHFLKYKDFIKALNIANIAAGISAGYSAIDDFTQLKNDTLSRYN